MRIGDPIQGLGYREAQPLCNLHEAGGGPLLGVLWNTHTRLLRRIERLEAWRRRGRASHSPALVRSAPHIGSGNREIQQWVRFTPSLVLVVSPIRYQFEAIQDLSGQEPQIHDSDFQKYDVEMGVTE